MLNNFLLTYSVQAQSTLDPDKEKASNVRDVIHSFKFSTCPLPSACCQISSSETT